MSFFLIFPRKCAYFQLSFIFTSFLLSFLLISHNHRLHPLPLKNFYYNVAFPLNLVCNSFKNKILARFFCTPGSRKKKIVSKNPLCKLDLSPTQTCSLFPDFGCTKPNKKMQMIISFVLYTVKKTGSIAARRLHH